MGINVSAPMSVERADAIVREPAAADSRVLAEVSFPRAESEAHGPGYFRMYAHDVKPLMQAWVRQRITGFADLFDLTYATEADATMTMRVLAAREISRDLNDNERALIAAVVRDLVVARSAERKRDRELSREVL
jgi:hypothetical protein